MTIGTSSLLSSVMALVMVGCGDSAKLPTESSIVYGLGVALTEFITVKNGAVEQSNFYDYHVPRMKYVPPMHIEVIQTDNHPTGAGQMATPLVAPAIAGAVAELTCGCVTRRSCRIG